MTSATATNANMNGCVVIEYRALISMKQIVIGTNTIGNNSIAIGRPLATARANPVMARARYTSDNARPAA